MLGALSWAISGQFGDLIVTNVSYNNYVQGASRTEVSALEDGQDFVATKSLPSGQTNSVVRYIINLKARSGVDPASLGEIVVSDTMTSKMDMFGTAEFPANWNRLSPGNASFSASTEVLEAGLTVESPP